MSEPLLKSGIVTIVGRSNVGKSTLMNTLVGTKIAIATPKPQTTRHIIQGVIHDPRGQIVFADTPGIFTKVPDILTSKLNEKAKDALAGIEALIYVVDPTRSVGDEEQLIHRLVQQAKCPKIMLLNKSDLKRPYIDEYMAWSNEFDKVIDVSALQMRGMQEIRDTLFEMLPVGEPLYPADRITNVENKFWVSELIREKLFMHLHEEIPYSTNVEVDEITTRPDGTVFVSARVLTTAKRYKKMIIGNNATKIKYVGRDARKEIELVTGAKVFLELTVDVDERWQERFE